MKTTLPYRELQRIGLTAGAFFLVLGTAQVGAALLQPNVLGTSPIAGRARVIDGDTIDLDGRRIRLEGIDAPELSQTCMTAANETWDCGRKAAAKLTSLIAENDVLCDQTGTDKYGRTLAMCFAAGININEAMVRTGFAWAFVKYSRVFETVEAEARAEKVGVWQGQAEPAWEYRHRNWQTAEQAAPKGCAIKGNISRGGHIYHMPWSPWYGNVTISEGRGERWFCSEAEALAAGWRPARPQ